METTVLRGVVGRTVQELTYTRYIESIISDSSRQFNWPEMLDEGLRVQDLGGSLSDVISVEIPESDFQQSIVPISYFHRLEHSLFIAGVVMAISLLSGIFSFAALTLFVRNDTVIVHPWVAFFLGVASVFLLIVSFASCFAIKQNLKLAFAKRWAQN